MHFQITIIRIVFLKFSFNKNPLSIDMFYSVKSMLDSKFIIVAI